MLYEKMGESERVFSEGIILSLTWIHPELRDFPTSVMLPGPSRTVKASSTNISP